MLGTLEILNKGSLLLFTKSINSKKIFHTLKIAEKMYKLYWLVLLWYLFSNSCEKKYLVMMHIFTIAVRQTIHACISNLKDVRHWCSAKFPFEKEVNLVHIIEQSKSAWPKRTTHL